MPLDQLDINFRSLSHPQFVMTLGNIAESLSAHPFFRNDWPAFLPSPQQLREQVNDLKDSIHAAADGDRKKIAERNAKRDAAELSAALMAQYVVMRSISEKDPTLLQNTGYTLKNRTYTKSSGNVVLGAPTSVTLKHGPVSGSVIVRSNKVAAAANYEVQVSVGDPTVEESWSTAGHFVHCRSMEVKGLEPAKRYNFRVRCHGATGAGPWSPNLNLIIL